MPYVGFSHSTASSIRHPTVRYGAFRSSVEVKADPAMPPIGYCVYAALRRHQPPIDRPPLCAETSAAPSPPEPRGPRSDRVCVVPAINAWRPHPPVRRTPCHFPVLPVIGAVLDIQRVDPVCPPHLPNFPCCTIQNCRLQYAGNPDACTSILPHRLWPSGRWKTLGSSNCPANQLHAG